MSVARRGAILLAAQSHRAGLAAERYDGLRELHLAVLPALEAVVDAARSHGGDGAAALGEVAKIARFKAARIRAELRRRRSASAADWGAIETLVADIESEAAIRSRTGTAVGPSLRSWPPSCATPPRTARAAHHIRGGR